MAESGGKESNLMRFQFADATSIVQAHQKDDKVQELLLRKLQEVLRLIKGQQFVNRYVNELLIFAKVIYLSTTTLRYKKTLGEEYVDLAYVNRTGKGVARALRRAGFLLGYCGVPWLCSRWFYQYKLNQRESGLFKIFKNKSFKDVFDSVLNLHLVFFYLNGQYYNLSKRFWGMRYVVGHDMNKNEIEFRKKSSQNYKALGLILLVQLTSKILPVITDSLLKRLDKTQNGNENDLLLPNKLYVEKNLSDPTVFPFIHDESRKCVLCLNNMIDPACATCGHVFCWDCIMEWTLERTECPLCRQRCLRQAVIPIR